MFEFYHQKFIKMKKRNLKSSVVIENHIVHLMVVDYESKFRVDQYYQMNQKERSGELSIWERIGNDVENLKLVTQQEHKFKKVRTLKDIQNDPRVDECFGERDGENYSYWCYLKKGWRSSFSGCHTIHEDTIKEICEELNGGIQVWFNDPELDHRDIFGM